MVDLYTVSKDKTAIKEQLGNEPRTTRSLKYEYYERVGVEKTVLIWERTVPTSVNAPFVVGHPAYGKVGTGLNPQPVVGTNYYNAITWHAVVSPNNNFIENFRDTLFVDTDVTTATVDTSTDYQVEFWNQT